MDHFKISTRNITIVIFLAFMTSTIFCQVGSQNSQVKTFLDIRRYDAWTVEYEPYRLLIENAIDEYIALTGDNVEHVLPGDIIIAVRSKTGKLEVFQIRYGTPTEGFKIIEGRQVGWVLGKTLMQTIYEKETYYHLDSSIPFEQQAIQPELDYLSTEMFWPRADLIISLSRSIYRFGNVGGIIFEWGNELIGRPYGEAGYMRIGIGTPVFKLGLQMPSIINFPNGYVDTDSSAYSLNGGWGGFGAFNFSNLYGEFSFLSNTGAMDFDQSVDITGTEFINYIDVSGLIFLNLGFSAGGSNGAFQIKPGFTFERIAHRALINGEIQPRRIDRSGTPFTYSESFFFGFFLRADYVSKLTRNKYPRLLGSVQLAGGTSALVKVVYNLNSVIGFPITFTHYLSEQDWQPKNSVLIGIRFRFDNPLN